MANEISRMAPERVFYGSQSILVWTVPTILAAKPTHMIAQIIQTIKAFLCISVQFWSKNDEIRKAFIAGFYHLVATINSLATGGTIICTYRTRHAMPKVYLTLNRIHIKLRERIRCAIRLSAWLISNWFCI